MASSRYDSAVPTNSNGKYAGVEPHVLAHRQVHERVSDREHAEQRARDDEPAEPGTDQQCTGRPEPDCAVCGRIAPPVLHEEHEHAEPEQRARNDTTNTASYASDAARKIADQRRSGPRSAPAEEDLSQSLDIRPDDALALRLRASARMQQSSFDLAEADAQAAVRLEPRNVDNLLVLGNVRESKRTGSPVQAQ